MRNVLLMLIMDIDKHSKLEVVAMAIIVAVTLWFIGGLIKCLYLLLMLL